MKSLITVGVVLVFALLFTRSVHGQDPCYDRDDLLRDLGNQYSDTVTW